ncbi:MAG: fasciclin domain-containing protein [Cyclobacteriaceae bacterium]
MKNSFLAIATSLMLLGMMSCAGGGGETADNGTADEGESTTTSMEDTAAMEQPQQDGQDIVALAQSQANLSTLVQAVQAADLVSTLQGEGPFTVFAPTNEAFEALPEGTLENLLKPENKDQLAAILKYHVVSGEVMSTDLSDGMTPETVEGSQLDVSIDGNSVKINDASVVNPNVEASNGVVHVVDKVMLPPNM